MRKMFFPITLIILAALLMAACTAAPGTTGVQPTSQIPSTGGTTGAETPSAVGTTSLTGVAPTSGATTGGATGAATSAATSEATGMATGTTTSGGAASGGLTATDTVAVPTSNSATSGSTGVSPTAESGSASGATTSTPGVGPVTGGTGAGSTTGTPAATMTTGTATTGGTTSGGTSGSGTTAGTPAATLSGPVPSAGSQTQGLYVRMSELLNANVNAQSSAQVGRVDGLMLERPLVAGVETTGTPNAPTATPVPMTGNQGIFVRYLMVNVSGASATSGNSASSGSTTGGNGNEIMVPWGAVATSAAGTVTLNVSSSAFSSAPRVSMLDVVSGSTTWASPAVAYWSGQGLSIPNTGTTTTGNATGSSLVFIPRERGGINITDEKDTVLGSVSDLLINPTSGEVVYAVFESGQAFGNRVFVLPMRSLIWVASSAGVSVADRGAFHLNFNSDLLKNAPSLNSLNQLQVSPTLINQLNAFWNSAIQALPVITTTPAPK